MMERAEFHQHIGDENMLPSLEAALARARGLLDPGSGSPGSGRPGSGSAASR